MENACDLAEQTDFCRAYACRHFDQRTICAQFEALFNQGDGGAPVSLTVRSLIDEPGSAAAPVLILAYIPIRFEAGLSHPG